MTGKNIVVKVVSVIMTLTLVAVSISGCNLVKQTGGKDTNKTSDVSLDKADLCCPDCSSTDITGPDADGNYTCNSCGAKWSYNEAENEIELKDENGTVIGTADINAGIVDNGSYYPAGGNDTPYISNTPNNNGSGSGSGNNSSGGTVTTTKKSAKVSGQDVIKMIGDIGRIVKAGVGEIVMDENGNLTVNNHPGQDTGLLGYKYSTTEKCFITAEDSWQRNFGFEETYDPAAGVGAMSYDTIRIRFNYDNKEWMIQCWKGQYGLALIGAEVGVYTRPAGSGTGTYYNCASDDEKLVMSMDVSRSSLTGSYGTINAFHRNPTKTWWLTAFVPGTLKLGTYVVPADATAHLTQYAKIVFDTPEQAQAFIGGLKSVDHIYHNMPSRSRKVAFKEFSYSEFDAATSVSSKYALESDGRTVRFSWR